jgi:hypothetical protein
LFRIWYLAGMVLAASLAVSLGNAQAVASNELSDEPALQQASAPQQAPAAQPAPQQQPTTPGQQQSQNPATASHPTDPQPETSAEQLRQEEKQRILGVMATFNMTNNQEALPLTPGQKFQLFFKGATDPWTIGITAISAGIGQAEDSPPEWKGGVVGYYKRFGAGYADTFDGNLWGNAILTSWWHEDPRFYRKDTGSTMKRFWWAAGSSFWCKRDNGTWGPNYANVIGNIIGGSIANLYYPPSQRGLDPTLEHSASVTYYGILGAEIIEFWPDIVGHYVKKHREKEEQKQARKAAQQNSQQTPPTNKP